MYYHRQLEKTVLKAAGEFACITLYGARQTGKSTMVRTIFNNIEYVTLDNSRERVLAKQDPELFLESHGIPLIIDEIQKIPELLNSIKINVDRSDERGQYLCDPQGRHGQARPGDHDGRAKKQNS